MIAHRSRQAMMDLLHTFDALMRPVIGHYGGRIVKTIGDAYMTVFESPTDAVLCAIRMQYVLRGYNKARAESDQIHVRIAINSGEVQIAGDGDVFGEAVNLTARLAGVTEADQIYLTEQVCLIMNRNEVPETLAVKKFSFKGIVGDVTVYRVVQNDDNAVYARIVAAQLHTPEDSPAARTSAGELLAGAKRAWSAGRWWIVGGGVLVAVAAFLIMHRGAPKPGDLTPAQKAAADSLARPTDAGRAGSLDVPKPHMEPLRVTETKSHADEISTVAQQLASPDDNVVREAARHVVRARLIDPSIMESAARSLQAGCAERSGNEVHADAMGWLCNVLGQSSGTNYVVVLEDVAARSVHAKVKRYALTNASELKRRAQR